MTRLSAVLAFSCLLALPVTAAGQMEVQGVDLTLGYAGWSGDDFEGADPGLRFQASAFSGTGGPLALGVTGTFGLIGHGEGLEADLYEYGLGITARLRLGSRSGPHAFLDAHAGYSRLEIRIPELALDLEENGFAVGPGFGFAIPFSGTTSFLVGGEYHYHSYSDVRFVLGPGLSDDGGSGWRWAGKAGFAIGVGS